MKKSILSFFFVAFALIAFSCSGNKESQSTEQEESKEVSMDADSSAVVEADSVVAEADTLAIAE